MKYSDAPDFLRDYLFYMQTIKGRSERTVQAYYVDLQGFLKYMYGLKYNAGRIDDEYLKKVKLQDITLDMLRSVTISDVYEYLNYVATDHHNNAKTRARKVSSIRSLFKYLTTIANKLCEMGVDIIVGGHPHKIQPLELITAENGNQTVCL